ncbi:MAG: hypothetical protein ABII26_01935 [Pseudomonadota bacterium]
MRFDLSDGSHPFLPKETLLFKGTGSRDGGILHFVSATQRKRASAEIREMIVKVRLFGYLAKYCKKDSFEEFEFTVPENSKPKDLLRLLGIPEGEIMMVINPGEKEKVLIVHETYGIQEQNKIEPNDKIWVYPFLDGG